MSVMTFNVTNSQGDKIGTWGDQKKRLASVDFVKKAFESFDVDKSGFIDPQELRAALTMLGVNPTMDALKDMGIEDKDGDGTLSLADLDSVRCGACISTSTFYLGFYLFTSLLSPPTGRRHEDRLRGVRQVHEENAGGGQEVKGGAEGRGIPRPRGAADG